MMKANGWKKMFATLALGGLMLAAPQLANADIAGDIAAGKNAAVVAREAVQGGMMPVEAALAAVKAEPQSTVAVAVAVAQESPNAAVNVVGALAEAQPEQALEIVRAVTQLYPDLAAEIAAAATKTICSDDQRKKYTTEKKQDALDVCSELYTMMGQDMPAIEAYEEAGAPANMVPTAIMQDSVGVNPGLDSAPGAAAAPTVPPVTPIPPGVVPAPPVPGVGPASPI